MSYALRDFGSYTVAGRTLEVVTGEPRTVNFTRLMSYSYDPRGHFAVEHAYVQYFVPERRRSAPPVVLVHGGGMCGSAWETTPDGRPGWLNLLVQRGHEVHVIDNVERGRSGFAPGIWDGEPILRSKEEAWHLFRIGSLAKFADRAPFRGSLFPVSDFDSLARMLVPRWLTTTPLQVAALVEVLRKVGPAIVICHSQGGEIALDALRQVSELFAGFVGIEPTARLDDAAVVARVPTVLMAGDFLDIEEHWLERRSGWLKWVGDVNAMGGAAALLESGDDLAGGHCHLPMLDTGNDDCLYRCLEALEARL